MHESDSGAHSFIAHFFETVSFAIATGDTTRIEEISLRSCKTCSAIRQNIDSLYAAEGRVQSDGWKLEKIGLSTAGPADTYALDIRVILTEETIVASPGAEPEQHPAINQPMLATVKWTADGWRMQELELKQ